MSKEPITSAQLFEDGEVLSPQASEEDTLDLPPAEMSTAASLSDSVDVSTEDTLSGDEGAPFPSTEVKDIPVSQKVEGIDPNPVPDELLNPIPDSKDIESVRQLILTLHQSIVPDMVNGDTVSDLIASIKPAEEAYNRILTGVRIPAGGNAPHSLDIDSLPTFDKIRRGLSAHNQGKS